MPEWLRGQTRNLMGSARVGSNPAANDARLDGRAVQGASFRHWSLRRRGFESHSNHFFLGPLISNLEQKQITVGVNIEYGWMAERSKAPV